MNQVHHFDAASMHEAFAVGKPLLETDRFQIHASRREAPGVVEVHRNATDTFHILEGRCTIVTGGTVIDPQEIAPGEIRGRRIEAGRQHQLQTGDVIVIPKGVPHWFQRVEPPLRYYTVKIID